jgi:hypothetical protein
MQTNNMLGALRDRDKMARRAGSRQSDVIEIGDHREING